MEKEGSALYLCPNCGAFVSEEASKCPNCGEVLDGGPSEEAPGPPEEALEQVTGREAEEEIALLEEDIAAEDASPPVTLYLCSVCGAFTGGDAITCPNCGASMGEDVPPEPLIKPGDPENGLFDMLVEADEPVEDEAKAETPDSGAGEATAGGTHLTEEDVLESLKNIESAEDVESFIESIKDDDSIDIELTPPAELLPERSDGSDDMLSQLVNAQDAEPGAGDKRSDALRSVEEMLDAEPGTGVIPADNDTIALCRSCGAFVSETAQVCNVCGNALKDGSRIVAQPEAPAPDEIPAEDGADSVMRSMLGVAEDADLDPDAGKRFQSDGSLGLCTVCGAFISKSATSCQICGTHIEDMPEFVPSMDIVGPEQEEHGLAICPHCGVFVPEGAKECLSCAKPIPEGATVPISRDIERPDEFDGAASTLRTFLGVEKALETAPVRDKSFSGLELCPDCGAFVSMDAIVCSVCGSPLFEGADDLLDIDRKVGEMELPACPHCGSELETGASECPSCGMAFFTSAVPKVPETPEEAFPEEPEPLASAEPSAPAEDDDILGLLVDVVEEEQDETGVDIGPQDADIQEEVPLDIPVPEPAIDIDQPIGESSEPQADFEPLEFIDEQPGVIGQIQESPEIRARERSSLPVASRADALDIEAPPHATVKATNWATGVYVSVAALCFFLFFYLIAPGDYAPGLAVIFGTLLLMGSYLAFAEKAIFFRGDLRHAGILMSGLLFAVLVLIHWPLGILVSEGGLAGQPALDRILLSVSVILTGIGLLWVRARVRFIFTWLSGTVMLFLATMLSFTYSGYGTGVLSPPMLVGSMGAGLVFLSFMMLQYERALQTSIETDIVRGDAHYLKKDYVSALASYDDALAKAQIKKVEALGSPIVEYDVPWYSKGSALILMGKLEEGIRCLDMAVAINPGNEVTWVNKGNAHSKLGQHDLAMECYERAIDCNPFYEVAWNNLGNVYARRRDYVGALKHYNRAIKINPRYDDAWINKGYVLAKMGKREQAIKCLNHVGSRAKGTPPVMERDIQTA